MSQRRMGYRERGTVGSDCDQTTAAVVGGKGKEVELNSPPLNPFLANWDNFGERTEFTSFPCSFIETSGLRLMDKNF
jgi:hypothetical protein